MLTSKQITQYIDYQFTCCECGCSMPSGYMSGFTQDVCVFCDVEADYEDYEYDDEDYS